MGDQGVINPIFCEKEGRAGRTVRRKIKKDVGVRGGNMVTRAKKKTRVSLGEKTKRGSRKKDGILAERTRDCHRGSTGNDVSDSKRG